MNTNPKRKDLLLIRDRNCLKCGSTVSLTVDHIKPLFLRGSNSIKNLQILCLKCNQEKGATTADYRQRSQPAIYRQPVAGCNDCDWSADNLLHCSICHSKPEFTYEYFAVIILRNGEELELTSQAFYKLYGRDIPKKNALTRPLNTSVKI